MEGKRHIRHRRSIPVADVPVGGIRIGLIIKPEIHRSLEIGI